MHVPFGNLTIGFGGKEETFALPWAVITIAPSHMGSSDAISFVAYDGVIVTAVTPVGF